MRHQKREQQRYAINGGLFLRFATLSALAALSFALAGIAPSLALLLGGWSGDFLDLEEHTAKPESENDRRRDGSFWCEPANSFQNKIQGAESSSGNFQRQWLGMAHQIGSAT